MRNAAVAPVHVPDVVRLDRVGGPVDIASHKLLVGPGQKVAVEMSAGEEGNGLFDDEIGADRVAAALKKLPFGESEWEEWEKVENAKKQQWEAEHAGHEPDEVRVARSSASFVD
jgi:hypothetical protein